MSRSVPVLASAIVGVLACGAALVTSEVSAATLGTKWTGSATCTLTTTGPFGYSDRQVHTWALSLWSSPTPVGDTLVSTYDWAETGSGSKTGISWSINGHNTSSIGFRTNNGVLNIGFRSAPTRDNAGITVTPSNGRSYPAAAYEWQFPLITAPVGSTDVVSAAHSVPVNGSVGFQQTGGSTTNAVCAWNFHFGEVQIGPPRRP